MIDIHSHILPGLDDGAPSLEVSLKMLCIAAAAGTTDIVATPHANTEYPFSPERVRQAVAEVTAAWGGPPRIHYGCDFHLSATNVQDALASPGKYTIDSGPYLLVELPDFYAPPAIAEILRRLQAAHVFPIVTHPERNARVRRRMSDLEDWVACGAFVQITAQSFLGRFGKEAKQFADETVRRGLAHFVASDAHDPDYRPPALDAVFSYLTVTYGDETASTLLRSNPAAALAGTPVYRIPPVKHRRRWFLW